MRAVFPARDCGSNHLDTSPSGIKNCFPAVPSPPGLLRENFVQRSPEWKSILYNFFTIFVECEIRERKRERKSIFLLIFILFILVEGNRRILSSFLYFKIIFFRHLEWRFSWKKFETQKCARWKENVLKDVGNTFCILFPRHRVCMHRMKLIKVKIKVG